MPAHLTRHATAEGPRWALDGHYLPPDFTLGDWLAWPQADAQARLAGVPVYVMPNPSGLNARVPLSELADHLRRASESGELQPRA